MDITFSLSVCGIAELLYMGNYLIFAAFFKFSYALGLCEVRQIVS